MDSMDPNQKWENVFRSERRTNGLNMSNQGEVQPRPMDIKLKKDKIRLNPRTK